MTQRGMAASVPDGMSNEPGMEEGYRILATILAGLLLYGGLGWLADHFLHTVFWLPLGIVVGTVLSLYLVVRRHAEPQGRTTTKSPESGSGREESQ